MVLKKKGRIVSMGGMFGMLGGPSATAPKPPKERVRNPAEQSLSFRGRQIESTEKAGLRSLHKQYKSGKITKEQWGTKSHAVNKARDKAMSKIKYRGNVIGF